MREVPKNLDEKLNKIREEKERIKREIEQYEKFKTLKKKELINEKTKVKPSEESIQNEKDKDEDKIKKRVFAKPLSFAEALKLAEEREIQKKTNITSGKSDIFESNDKNVKRKLNDDCNISRKIQKIGNTVSSTHKTAQKFKDKSELKGKFESPILSQYGVASSINSSINKVKTQNNISSSKSNVDVSKFKIGMSTGNNRVDEKQTGIRAQFKSKISDNQYNKFSDNTNKDQRNITNSSNYKIQNSKERKNQNYNGYKNRVQSGDISDSKLESRISNQVKNTRIESVKVKKDNITEKSRNTGVGSSANVTRIDKSERGSLGISQNGMQRSCTNIRAQNIGGGIRSQNTSGVGVRSQKTNGVGIRSQNTSGVGIKSQNTSGVGIRAQNTGGGGIRAQNTGGGGIRAQNSGGVGIRAQNSGGVGIRAQNNGRIIVNKNVYNDYDSEDDEYDEELDDFIDDSEVHVSNNVRKEIYKCLKFDPNKYSYVSKYDDCNNMESSSKYILDEERRSYYRAVNEDAEEKRLENLRKLEKFKGKSDKA